MKTQTHPNPSIRKLADEGYALEVTSHHLIIREIPYLNKDRKVHGGGIIVMPLDADDQGRPGDHTLHFAGHYPCDLDGKRLRLNPEPDGIDEGSDFVAGISVNYIFSFRPREAAYDGKHYGDYHHKATYYIKNMSKYAQELDRSVSACGDQLRAIYTENASPFLFADTSSERAHIAQMNGRFRDQKVGIIGLGGSGSYILDFVAKTHVEEIHLYDDDCLKMHNAFRIPGAMSVEEVRQERLKVNYHSAIYSKMRRGIQPHEYRITGENLEELEALDFVFICSGRSREKEAIVKHLLELGIPFIDVGMGISKRPSDKIPSLIGMLRSTIVTPEAHGHASRYIRHEGITEFDDYSNIQIAELNALNACLAVVQWKKFVGQYYDHGKEINTFYILAKNSLINAKN